MNSFYMVRQAGSKKILAGQVRCARSFAARLVGLIGRRELFRGEGLWIPRCSSIHTLGMSFSLDVVFLDERYTVVSTEPGLKPWRHCRARSSQVLELPAGTLSLHDLRIGDRLEFIPAVERS